MSASTTTASITLESLIAAHREHPCDATWDALLDHECADIAEENRLIAYLGATRMAEIARRGFR